MGILLWDSGTDPAKTSGDIWYWERYANDGAASSIPRYLELHACRLRSKYLAFIHDLGEAQLEGIRIVDLLDIGDSCSFWWMSQVAEKSPFKSPRIYDCLRILALEEILIQQSAPSLSLVTSNRDLAEAVQTLCRNLKIAFVWQRAAPTRRKWTALRLLRNLPHPLQAILTLGRHVLMRLPLKWVEEPEWYGGSKSIFLCTYFFNLDAKARAEGRFHSMQWGDLPDFLNGNGYRVNWIHHILTSSGMPNAFKCAAWIRVFSRGSQRKERHAFLDTYLSWRIVFRALRRWARLLWISLRMKNVRMLFRPRESSAWLWPFLREDWHTSLTGRVCVNNCLWVELFDAIFENMPRQDVGLYLWENQGWESAMLHSWRKHGHGKMIGVPHATVCFWHLNNFDDPRTTNSGQGSRKPMPNYLAVNGLMARRAFTETGYPTYSIVDVEALRFQYLERIASADGANEAQTVQGGVSVHKRVGTKVLILGDLTFTQTIKMLRCAEEASRLFPGTLSFTLKRHPACRIDKRDFPTFSFELADGPIGTILKDYNYAFSSNSTSAGLDAYLAGLQVAVFLDDATFNNSPLRGINAVCFVSTPKELADSLRSPKVDADRCTIEEVFWIDKRLPRWRKILSESGPGG